LKRERKLSLRPTRTAGRLIITRLACCLQGWRRGSRQQGAAAPGTEQDKDGRLLHAGHVETGTSRRPSSSGIVGRWWLSAPYPKMTTNDIGSSSAEQAARTNKQQVSSRMPSLEIGLGRQGWQHDQQQEQRGLDHDK
jgi:hypothetical protein